MLKNAVKINKREYFLREGTYTKNKVEPTIPRYGVGDINLSDLTRWNYWGQSLWHGGFNQKFLTEKVPLSFYRSNDIDVFIRTGELRLAQDISDSNDMPCGLADPVGSLYLDNNNEYIFFGGNESGNLSLRKLEAASNSASVAWSTAMAGDVLAMTPFIKSDGLFFSYNETGSNNFGLKKYTDTGTVSGIIDSTGASGDIAETLVTEGNNLYLFASTGQLRQYDGSTVTLLDSNIDLYGNRGQQACAVAGNLYWISFKRGQGRLMQYNLNTDSIVEVYDFGFSFRPNFIYSYNNRVMVGGENTDRLAASVWEYNPFADNIKNTLLFENDDVERYAEYGGEHGNMFMCHINDGSGNNRLYAYFNNRWCLYLKDSYTNLPAGPIFTSRDRLVIPGNGLGGGKIVCSAGGNVRVSGRVESSKIDMNLFEADKLFGGLTVYHDPLPANTTAAIRTRIDDDTVASALTQLGYNGTQDSTSFDVELLSGNIGKKIEYFLDLKSSGTNTPRIQDVIIRYLLYPTPKYEWSFDVLLIDNIREYGKQISAKQLKSDLESAFEDAIIDFTDIDGTYFSNTKDGTADRGIIFDKLELLGPYLQSDEVEYIARIHLIEG